MKNYYEILNVQTNATFEQIVASYNNLIKINHPDNNVSATDSEKKEFLRKTQLINEAYDCLKDPQKRRKYDIQHGINSKNEYEGNNHEFKNNSSTKTTTRATQFEKKHTKSSTHFKSNIPLVYDFIANFINKKYEHKTTPDGTIIYYNDSKKIVGVNTNGIITLYFDCPCKTIQSHNDHIMIGIAKNFPILNNNEYRLSDIIMMRGMCGMPNVYVKNGFFIKDCPDWNISNNDLGSVGFYDNDFFSIPTEKGNINIKLNNMPYEFKDYYRYPDHISFYTLIEKVPHSLSNEEKQSLLKQFEQIRIENDWHWKSGFNTAGSDKTRANIDYLCNNSSNYHTKDKAFVDIDFELNLYSEISTEKNER